MIEVARSAGAAGLRLSAHDSTIVWIWARLLPPWPAALAPPIDCSVGVLHWHRNPVTVILCARRHAESFDDDDDDHNNNNNNKTPLRRARSERWRSPVGHETQATMAVCYRVTALSSLFQVCLLLLLLNRNSGRPSEKCVGGASCRATRPPVVLSKPFKAFLTLFSNLALTPVAQPSSQCWRSLLCLSPLHLLRENFLLFYLLYW